MKSAPDPFVGGMLFCGPIGALAAGITALFEEASGGNLVDHLAEMVDDFTGGGDNGDPAIAADAAAKAASATPKSIRPHCRPRTPLHRHWVSTGSRLTRQPRLARPRPQRWVLPRISAGTPAGTRRQMPPTQVLRACRKTQKFSRHIPQRPLHRMACRSRLAATPAYRRQPDSSRRRSRLLHRSAQPWPGRAASRQT